MAGWPITRPPLLALLPIEPRSTANGLAMRAGRFLAAAERDFRPLAVVIPVAGRAPSAGAPPSGALIANLGNAGDLRSGTIELMADPQWRTRLAETQPLPALARAASPGWAASVSRQIADTFVSARGAPVHVMRSYLAPIAMGVAERLGAPWATLDLDDDDASYERARGRKDEAEAFDRLVRGFAPLFSGVAAASPSDAERIAERYGIAVATVPNTVPLPTAPARDPERPPRLLFVGNLTYEPNIEAAELLVSAVLPGLRRVLDTPVGLTLVGGYDPDGPLAPFGALSDVDLVGVAADLEPVYAQASAVVAPLPPGGGTKIKILEAFAHRVPVVTTPAGAAGLGVTDGRHLLLGDNAGELVLAAAEVLRNPALAGQLADQAYDYVRMHHAPSVGDRAVHQFLADAARSGSHSRSPIG